MTGSLEYQSGFSSGCRRLSPSHARANSRSFTNSLSAFFGWYAFHRTAINYFGGDGPQKVRLGGEHTDSNHLLM